MSTPTPITPNQATGNQTAHSPSADVESFINEYYAAWHGTDEDRIMKYYSEDVTVQIPGGIMQGHTAVREQFVRPYITGFPRNRHLVKNMIFGRDEVTVEFTFDAQHRGPFAGHPATDAHVQVAGCAVYQYDLARRQITTARIYFDVATLLKQLFDPGYSRGTDEGTPQSTVGMAAPTDYLDLATVIGVSQAVSGEMVLERLIDILMRMAVTHAGAERALLILSRKSEPRIAAEARASADTVMVHLCDEPITGAPLPGNHPPLCVARSGHRDPRRCRHPEPFFGRSISRAAAGPFRLLPGADEPGPSHRGALSRAQPCAARLRSRAHRRPEAACLAGGDLAREFSPVSRPRGT